MICTLTFFLHVFWTVGISRSNAIDLGVTYHYAGKIQEALGITFPCELNTEIDSAKKRRRRIWRWAHLAEVLFTAALTN